MKNEPKQMVNLLETYLNEFCEVMGVTEKELPKHMVVYSNPQDKFMAILSAKDRDRVMIGVKLTENSYEISGEYVTEKDKFPKTRNYADSINE